MRLRSLIALVGFGAALAAGSAVAAPTGNGAPREDPFEAMNRRFYAGQNGFDRHVFLPLARFYHFLTPGPIGAAIHNFIANLGEPVIIANDILQVRLRDAGHETLRLTANSTAGLLGVIDVATPSGLERRDNDFGITLGRLGVGPGPYLYLPVLGPTTVRDALGAGVDTALDPLIYFRFPGHETLLITTGVVGGLDTRYRAEPQLQALLGDATDPYATLRSVYLQNREAQVRGETTTPILTPLDDPPEQPAAPPATDQDPPAPASQAAPAASAAAPQALADAAPDPDAPIATARPYDLEGVGAAPHRGA